MTSRAYNALLGALTADAAGLGVHWLYGDNARVARSLGGVEPEFQEPDEARYAERPSYYAHGGKTAGDLTHAGESALTVLRELVRQKRDGSELDEAAVGSALAAHFGPGGAYTGYVDSALRAACRNVEDRNALQGVAPERPVDGPLDEAGARMIARTKLPGLIRKFGVADEEQLRHAMEMAVRATHDFEEAVAYGNACVDAALELQKRPTGASDLQMSGIANLVPTVARFAERDDLANLVERVVRVTQNEDEPVAFAQAAAALLQRAITQPDFDVRAELEAGLKAAPENDLLRDVWSRALERAKEEPDTEVVTGEFGRACYVKSGWPSIVHTLYHATSYVDGIRRCLLAGGDSVPRAAFVGAVLAARFGLGGEQGLPVSWLLRVSKAKEIEELASAATS